MTLRQRIIVAVISYLVIVYAISYIAVWMDPYWYDDSPRPEYIPVPERWIWAFWVYLAYVIWGSPLLLVAIAVIIHRTKR